MRGKVRFENVKVMQKRGNWYSGYSLFRLFAWMSVAITGCALPASPDGGPRDQQPPIILTASIRLGSTGIEAEKATWTFDEYVVLASPQQNMLSSPPLPAGTTYELKGKTLVISWPEPLLDSSTYVLQWGNTVRDLHEGNVLKGIQWVFSTGNALDSGELRGQVVDPWSGKGVKDAAVCLYPADVGDSCVMGPARYATRSNDSGYYHFTYLRENMSYALRAFADADGNNKLSTGEITPIAVTATAQAQRYVESAPYDLAPPLPLLSATAIADSLLDWTPWGEDSAGVFSFTYVHGCGPMIGDSLAYPNARPIVIQLKGKLGVYAEWTSMTPCATQKGEVHGLPPGKYTLQAFYDQNSNGVLDAGDYWEVQQPETRIFAKDPIEIKAQWTIESTWEIDRYDPIYWGVH